MTTCKHRSGSEQPIHGSTHTSASKRLTPLALATLLLSSAYGCAPLDDLDDYSPDLDAGVLSNGVGQVPSGGPDAGGLGSPQGDESPIDAVPDGALGGTSSDNGDQQDGSDPQPNTPTTDAGAPLIAPRVVQSQPSNGQGGVDPNASIVMDFDRSMDTSSVAAGLRLEGPEVPTLTLGWSQNNQRLTVGFATPLAMATGSDPSGLTAFNYRLVLQGARDAQGGELPVTLLNFSTLRHIQVTRDAVASSDATGNWRSDDIHGTSPCDETGNRICVGDSSLGVNERYSGFATFELPDVSPGAQQLQAELQLTVVGLLGTPFADLGDLLIEKVAYSGIGPSAFSTPAIMTVGTVPQAENPELLRMDVASAIDSSTADNALLQVRLRFETATDSDGATDLVFFDRQAVRIALSYFIP